MVPGISPASAICCITRASRPTIAQARAILIRSTTIGEADSVMARRCPQDSSPMPRFDLA